MPHTHRKRKNPYITPGSSGRRRKRVVDFVGEGLIDYATGIPTLGSRLHRAYDAFNKPGEMKYQNAQLAAGSTKSTCVVRGKKFKKTAKIERLIKNVSAIHEHIQIGSQRIAAFAYGRQAYQCLGYDQAGTLPSTFAGAGGRYVNLGLFSQPDLALIETAINNVANATYGTSGAIGSAGSRFIVEKGVAKYDLTNSTTANITLTLYDFQPRQNIHYALNSNLVPPELAWYAGSTSSFQDSNITQAGSTQNSASDPSCYIGATPFQSNLFCSWYKIIKVTKVCLAPGVCYTHSVVQKPHRIFEDVSAIDASIANAPSTDIVYIRKLTTMTFAVLSGTPAHDSSGNSTENIGAIDVVWNKTYHFAYGPAYQRQLRIYTDIRTSAQTGTIQQVAEATNAMVTTVDI